MVEEVVATEEAVATVEAVAGMGMVKASVVAIILLVGAMAIGRKAKKPWIGSAIMGADWAVSFGINLLGLATHWISRPISELFLPDRGIKAIRYLREEILIINVVIIRSVESHNP
jgi:hypothetical protein